MHPEIALLVAQARRDAVSHAKLLKEQLLPAVSAAEAAEAAQRSLTEQLAHQRSEAASTAHTLGTCVSMLTTHINELKTQLVSPYECVCFRWCELGLRLQRARRAAACQCSPRTSTSSRSSW